MSNTVMQLYRRHDLAGRPHSITVTYRYSYCYNYLLTVSCLFVKPVFRYQFLSLNTP